MFIKDCQKERPNAWESAEHHHTHLLRVDRPVFPTIIWANITAYNTVEAQCDSSPCQAAGGYICGRNDVVACPRQLALGTKVKINGKQYICFDRLAPKYNNRFDISFDKDIQGAKNWGKRYLPVEILS
jgi:hypothetical protein